MLAGLDDWREQVRRDFGQLARVPHANLAWVTVIADVRVVGVTDDMKWVPGLVTDFRAALRGQLMQTGQIWRGTRWRGVVEFDLLHPQVYRLGAVKSRMLGAFGIDPATVPPADRVIVTHVHMVMDCSGHGGREPAADALHRLYRKPRQVMVKPLRDGPVADHLERLAGYSTKVRLQYSRAWDEQQTKYLGAYEPEWVALVQQIITGVGWEGLTFKGGS